MELTERRTKMPEKDARNRFLSICGGWSGVSILLAVFLLFEIGLPKAGGDWAAFLYVTCHFIVIPLWSAFILILTALKAYQTKNILVRMLTLSSMIIPGLLLYTTAQGSTWLPTLLGVNFNK